MFRGLYNNYGAPKFRTDKLIIQLLVMSNYESF